ncbi:MAG: response regulator transcription factor [Pseudomonadota bacterium]|nr:response regulator transcription factor [Pseudomonadota bacterium]
MRILLIEDDSTLRNVMCQQLQDTGNRVDTAGDLATADHLWSVQQFDGILLDLNLPATDRPNAPMLSGLSLLQKMRAKGDRTPVLVLSARNRTEERIAGLDAGADDYLGKPFELNEVEARLRAVLRRSQGADDQTQVGQLKLNRLQRRFSCGDEALQLPAREFEVLWELMSPPGRVINKRNLSDKLSSFDESLGDNALETFISRLRRKLEGTGAVIRTMRGIGYVLEEAS